MTTVAQFIGNVVAVVALLNTLWQIISYLSGGENRQELWTWIKERVNDLTAPAPAPAPTINNNQTYNNKFTEPCTIHLYLGNDQAQAVVNRIQGSCRQDQIAHLD